LELAEFILEVVVALDGALLLLFKVAVVQVHLVAKVLFFPLFALAGLQLGLNFLLSGRIILVPFLCADYFAFELLVLLFYFLNLFLLLLAEI
jgi:hypothetical protein